MRTDLKSTLGSESSLKLTLLVYFYIFKTSIASFKSSQIKIDIIKSEHDLKEK